MKEMLVGLDEEEESIRRRFMGKLLVLCPKIVSLQTLLFLILDISNFVSNYDL